MCWQASQWLKSVTINPITRVLLQSSVLMTSCSSTSFFGSRPEPWELRECPEPDAVAGDDSDGGEPSIEDMTPEECSSEFMNLIVHLKLSGVISAKHACVLSYWAKGAGLCAPGSALALSPTQSGGAFSKHFDKVVGVGLNRREMFHELTVPVFERWSFSRSTATVQANWVHLQLAEEVRSLIWGTRWTLSAAPPDGQVATTAIRLSEPTGARN